MAESRLGGCMRKSETTLWMRTAVCAFTVLLAVATPPFARSQGLVSSDLSRLRFVGGVQLAPDGPRAAYTVVMQDRPGRPYPLLAVMDLGTQKSTTIGDGKAPSGNPHWSPDGKWLAFQGSQGDKHGLFVARADGSEMTFMAAMKGTNSPLPGEGENLTWSPDGKQIAFVSSTPSE